jgi:DNA-binding transcriptional ArsR family regulator
MTETARPPRATGAGADPDADDASLGAISKGLRILEVLAHDGPILGLSEIARRAEIAKTTTLRALVSLQDGGYVERSGKKYRLSWRVLGLNRGAPFCEPGGLLDVALPHLSELHQTSGLSVSLGVTTSGTWPASTEPGRSDCPAGPEPGYQRRARRSVRRFWRSSPLGWSTRSRGRGCPS